MQRPQRSLAYFRAEPVDEGIEVRWQFAAPPAETAVDLERGDTEVGPWVTIARTLRVDRGEHAFVDRDAAPDGTTSIDSDRCRPARARSYSAP